MTKKDKIITGVAGAVVAVAGVVGISLIPEGGLISKTPPPARYSELVERNMSGVLTYDEFLELIDIYNVEIEKAKKSGGEFVLKDVNASESIVHRLNQKVLNK